MYELVFLTILPVYLIAFVVGIVEGQLFLTFLRRRNPELVEQYYPSVFRRTIAGQFRTTRWLWNRGYRSIGDDRLNKRAGLHRTIRFAVLLVVAICLVVLLVGRLISTEVF